MNNMRKKELLDKLILATNELSEKISKKIVGLDSSISDCNYSKEMLFDALVQANDENNQLTCDVNNLKNSLNNKEAQYVKEMFTERLCNSTLTKTIEFQKEIIDACMVKINALEKAWDELLLDTNPQLSSSQSTLWQKHLEEIVGLIESYKKTEMAVPLELYSRYYELRENNKHG